MREKLDLMIGIYRPQRTTDMPEIDLKLGGGAHESTDAKFREDYPGALRCVARLLRDRGWSVHILGEGDMVPVNDVINILHQIADDVQFLRMPDASAMLRTRTL